MDILEAINTLTPLVIGFVTLVIVLAKMHADIDSIKQKISTIFDLINSRWNGK